MKRFVALFTMSFLSFSAWSLTVNSTAQDLTQDEEVNEFDPFAADALQTLADFDQAYRAQTNAETFFSFANPFAAMTTEIGGCSRGACHIFANVVKSAQVLYLYIDGVLNTSWLVSTGRAGHTTPNFDFHPQGPFYPGAYTSHKYPGGDWKGLGNMPYASFYNGGFAVHGTPAIAKLGQTDSHGCVRSHPDNAHYFSQLVRAAGKSNVWITVSNQPVSTEPTLILR